jgi:hypothetical protein
VEVRRELVEPDELAEAHAPPLVPDLRQRVEVLEEVEDLDRCLAA